MRLQHSFEAAARRQVRSALVVATLLGTLSLLITLRTLQARQNLDQETLAGLVDAVLTLGLAYGVTRGSRVAPFLLLILAFLGMALTLWRGFPALTVMPQVVASVFYARAIAAQRYLSKHTDGVA